MAVDPRAHKFFKTQNIYAVESVVINRNALKKQLYSWGLKDGCIEFGNSIEDAVLALAKKKYHIIFARLPSGGNDEIVRLYEMHEKQFPDRTIASFFVITDNNALSVATLSLEYNIDGILLLPFMPASLEKVIMNGVKSKFEISPYQKKLEEGHAQFRVRSFAEAIELFTEAVELNPIPLSALYWKGVCFRELKNDKEAIKCWEKVLATEPRHYKSSKAALSHYITSREWDKSQKLAARLIQEYPMNPKDIPNYTTVSIFNKRYEDIIKYADVFKDVKNPDQMLSTYMAAGLAICGRFFLQLKKDEDGLKIIHQAGSIAGGNIKIIRSLCYSLLKVGNQDEAVLLMGCYVKPHSDQLEAAVLDFEVENYLNEPKDYLVEAEKLISEDQDTPSLYFFILERLAANKCDPDLLGEWKEKAKLKFPKIFA